MTTIAPASAPTPTRTASLCTTRVCGVCSDCSIKSICVYDAGVIKGSTSHKYVSPALPTGSPIAPGPTIHVTV